MRHYSDIHEKSVNTVEYEVFSYIRERYAWYAGRMLRPFGVVVGPAEYLKLLEEIAELTGNFDEHVVKVMGLVVYLGHMRGVTFLFDSDRDRAISLGLGTIE